MAKAKSSKKFNETFLQRQARLARDREFAEQRDRPLVTDEMAQHGDYEEGWTELEGNRARVVINRGGSTVQRWLSGPHDHHIGEAEKAAIRYCLSLWQRIDCKGPRVIRVDCDAEGASEHEALAELASFKARIPARYWDVFENVCRFELAATARHTKVTVGFVAGMIAMWRGL